MGARENDDAIDTHTTPPVLISMMGSAQMDKEETQWRRN